MEHPKRVDSFSFNLMGFLSSLMNMSFVNKQARQRFNQHLQLGEKLLYIIQFFGGMVACCDRN